LVQWGTLVGVAIYFWRDIWQITRAVLTGLIRRRPFESPESRLGWWVIIATIPAVIFGLLLKRFVESLYGRPPVIAALIIVTAALLVAAERWSRRQRRLDSMGLMDSIVIGLWQVLALIPGVSRSGSTISGGMLRGFERADAARFSFLLSIPALLGAGLVAIKDLFGVSGLLSSLAVPLAAGFIAAAISGYLVIRWLLGYLKRRSMNAFAIYRVAFGALCLIIALARG
jgi:undecaprenyl-diphosphatase